MIKYRRRRKKERGTI